MKDANNSLSGFLSIQANVPGKAQGIRAAEKHLATAKDYTELLGTLGTGSCSIIVALNSDFHARTMDVPIHGEVHAALVRRVVELRDTSMVRAQNALSECMTASEAVS